LNAETRGGTRRLVGDEDATSVAELSTTVPAVLGVGHRGCHWREWPTGGEQIRARHRRWARHLDANRPLGAGGSGGRANDG
ncbi:MAG: hypothetical protein ACRD03_05665, partial [Acidimicrobiales bacterium]